MSETGYLNVAEIFGENVFNEICCVDYFPDFQWKLEENSQVIPVIPP